MLSKTWSIDEINKLVDQAFEDKEKAIDTDKDKTIAAEKVKYDQAVTSNNALIAKAKEKYDKLTTDQELYNETTRLLEDKNQGELLGLLKIYEPDWQNQGQSFAEKFIEGLNSKKTDMETAVSLIMDGLKEVTNVDISDMLKNTDILEEKFMDFLPDMKANSAEWTNQQENIFNLNKKLQDNKKTLENSKLKTLQDNLTKKEKDLDNYEAILAQDNILKVEVVDFEELGMEAVRKITVKDFPAFIITDDKGNDFFANL
jgi:hypothetical protein